AVTAILGGIVFAGALIFIAPRLLAPLGRLAEREAAQGLPMSSTVLSFTLMAFTLSAFTADAIGLHAVFGGFLLGVVMPRGALAERVKGLLEPFTVVLLLPMFFTYSGLNTQLTMVNS